MGLREEFERRDSDYIIRTFSQVPNQPISRALCSFSPCRLHLSSKRLMDQKSWAIPGALGGLFVLSLCSCRKGKKVVDQDIYTRCS
ncbi:hypothetical protein [Phaffia rhodozyma]|uniref:Uncharacterized protein n=1 Tax=Phaffia rhodozyma TaxID=264483 RepID=A0A0F7SR42_PHARH|nr:hypothetical protein [Phaffia rhodozyma]